MKKLMKNKRTITGLVAMTLGVAILLMGLSLAWFTSSGGGTVNTIELGTLIVDGDLEIEDAGLVFNYPGTEVYYEGVAWIKNVGSLNALCQLDIKTTIYDADAQGVVTWGPVEDATKARVEIIEDETTFINDPFGAATVLKKTHELGTWGIYYPLSGDFDSYNWLVGADGKYYVQMFGNDDLHFAYNLILDPSLYGDSTVANPKADYQGSFVDVQLKWNAVQADPLAAVEAILPGVVIQDYEAFPGAGFDVPTPVYDVGGGVYEPFFTALDGFTFITYDAGATDPFGGDGVYPDEVVPGGLQPFGSYDQQEELVEAYLNTLPETWLKYAIMGANGLN
ncbi:MAG: hypothetical protein FWH57_02855 [Oscillospiraceae bacterium]|nr:hypothetical protein [Oscillospiraceae bacterium]